MATRWRVPPTFLLPVFVLALYAPRLAHSPIYLHYDEVYFALNAHSIALSGHDSNGRFLPLYFHIHDNIWFQPILVYFTALFLKLLPVSESTIRLPSVFVGLIDVLLMYFIAKRIFERELPAIIASALLALTPAHFIHSRLAMDYLYPVPFVMAWLLCLLIFLERRRSWLVLAGTTFLGIGVYSHIASLVMMPVYLALTYLALFQQVNKPGRLCLAATLSFALPLLLLIPWQLAHPTVYAEQIVRYRLYDSTSLSPLQGLRALVGLASLAERLSVYYNYFNPSFLFVLGDASGIDSTRRAGVFLLPLAVFAPVGIHHIVKHRRVGVNLILLLGFASAPAAATLVAEGFRISRALVMLPFAVLIATFGVEHLVSTRHKTWRTVGILLLALGSLQFAYFYADYMTAYRERSSVVFERNIRGALEEIIARDRQEPAAAVYLSTSFRWIEYYWKFYAIKHDREEILKRTVYYNPEAVDLHRALARSIILTRCCDAHEEALVGSGEFRNVTAITEPNGSVSFIVCEK